MWKAKAEEIADSFQKFLLLMVSRIPRNSGCCSPTARREPPDLFKSSTLWNREHAPRDKARGEWSKQASGRSQIRPQAERYQWDGEEALSVMTQDVRRQRGNKTFRGLRIALQGKFPGKHQLMSASTELQIFDLVESGTFLHSLFRSGCLLAVS